jgi:hypothetical protein
MTITDAPPASSIETIDSVVLDGALFFQPPPVLADLERYARVGVGVDVSVRIPTDGLAGSPLTGVSRMLVEAAAETRLRNALRAAGYLNVSRRVDGAAVVLAART